jgi:hypothetical protein
LLNIYVFHWETFGSEEVWLVFIGKTSTAETVLFYVQPGTCSMLFSLVSTLLHGCIVSFISAICIVSASAQPVIRTILIIATHTICLPRLIFLEASAKTAHNVEEAFVGTAAAIYDNIVSGVYDIKNESFGVKMGAAALQQGGVRPTATQSDQDGQGGGCC